MITVLMFYFRRDPRAQNMLNSYQDIYPHSSSTNSMSVLSDNTFCNQDTSQDFCHRIVELGDRTLDNNLAIEIGTPLG